MDTIGGGTDGCVDTGGWTLIEGGRGWRVDTDGRWTRMEGGHGWRGD